MPFLWILVALLLFSAQAHAAVDTFANDVQMCSGRPWVDVTCNGADPTGVADSTAAINTTTAAAISNDWPIFFPAGTYKVTSKITLEYGGQANNGPQVISQGAAIDGRSIASGNVLQVQCNGGSTASPVVCNHFQISGWLTVMGSGAGYVVTLGKTDFSDQQNAVRIEHLVVSNASTGGAIQANYLTDGDLWLSGSTQGGSSSVGAVALEQVQTSKVAGWGSALGASAPGLLIENGASVGDLFSGFAYDPNDATCISITAAAAQRNVWLAPYLPCTTGANAPTAANHNILIGATFAGTNRGPTTTGIEMVGHGSVHRYLAPAVASQTLFGSDDGIILSSANATGASTQFSAASLPVTLPDPVQVGSGWTAAFVSDMSKAVVIATPGTSKILARNQQLSSLTVGTSGTAQNYEIAVLESDGATGFRLTYISQGAALLNGIQNSIPANWIFPGGPGYQTTIGDNANVVSSRGTSAGLTVTLPQTTTLSAGWTIDLVADGLPLTVTVNGTAGGIIKLPGKANLTTYQLPAITNFRAQVQFDGANFRVTPFSLVGGCVNIIETGGDPTNTNDNAPALNLALANTMPGRACVSFPPGTYKFLSGVTYNYPATLPNVPASVSLIGSGSEATELTFPNAVGAAITLNLASFSDTFHLDHFTCSTGTVMVDKCLVLNQTATTGTTIASGAIQSDITDVVFRSNEGVWNELGTTTTHGWAYGAYTNNVSFVGFENVSAFGPSPNPAGPYAGTGAGSGVSINGTSNTVIPVVFNFHNCNYQWLTNGILVGQHVQGVTVSQSNFTGNFAGIGVPPSEAGLDQLSISVSQFNNQMDLNILSTVFSLLVTDNLFLTAQGPITGTKTEIAYPVPGGLSTITSNQFIGFGSGLADDGIVLNTSSTADIFPGSVISGNSFINLRDALTLGVGTRLITTRANAFAGNAVNIINIGGANNSITGLMSAGGFPPVANVSNATLSPADGVRTRLTVNDTSQFVTGEVVSVSGVGGVPNANVIAIILVMDATHMDLAGNVFSGTYTGGGIVSALP